jgi:integrase
MVNQILVNGTPRQAEKALVVVRTAYNWALGNMRRKKQVRAKSAITSTVTQTRIIDPRLNPCDGIVIPEYEPRTYHLEGEALQEFLEDLDTLPAPYADILMLQLMTVTRVGEVAGMHADEIDMKKQIWTIPAARTKNARAHKVMLSDQAMAIIEKYLDKNTGYLFPFKAGHITSDKVGHVIAGWGNRPHSDFTSHSLRHTGTTWLADNEAPLEVRDRITNHVPQNMDARYNHASYNRQAKQWLQKYSDFLENSG